MAGRFKIVPKVVGKKRISFYFNAMQTFPPSSSYLAPDIAEQATDQPSSNSELIYQLYPHGVMPDKMEDSYYSSSYFFLLDLITKKYIYVSSSVKKILSYSAEDFMNGSSDFSLKLCHPKDVTILKNLQKRLYAYFYATEIHERHKLKFTFNIRMRRSDGSYMHILQQTVFIKISKKGDPLVDFSTVTDITPFKKDKHHTLVVHKLTENGEDEEVYKEEFVNYDFAFTRRQLEIITLISQGLTTKEIAAKLFLSIDTVKNHRKNILKMTGSKNIVEVFTSMSS
jgi:DNA-binding CsgD family transcriptional regulator